MKMGTWDPHFHLDTQWPSLTGQGLEYSKDNPTGSSTPVHPDLALSVEKMAHVRKDSVSWTWWWNHLASPEWEALCKESGNETIVHSVNSPLHGLMHNSNADNQVTPVEWDGKFT